jgi:hypothetical protein
MNPKRNVEATTTIAELPLKIGFSYGGKSLNISLIKGNDVFKLAEIFKNILSKNEIEYDIEILENK